MFGKKKQKKDPVNEAQKAALKAMEAEQELSELVNRMVGNNILTGHIESNRTDIALMRARIGR
jgi:hypothetical protein